MTREQYQQDFDRYLNEDEGLVTIIFDMAQTLVQDAEPDSKETQALNIIVGSSFALLHAIKNYKEIRNGEDINHRS